jgi:hypothetical protein
VIASVTIYSGPDLPAPDAGWRAGPVARRLYLQTQRDSDPQQNIAVQEVSRKGATPQRIGTPAGPVVRWRSGFAVPDARCPASRSRPRVNCQETAPPPHRYVERNALRANLVERPEQWPWSSLGRPPREDPAFPILAVWPLPRVLTKTSGRANINVIGVFFSVPKERLP